MNFILYAGRCFTIHSFVVGFITKCMCECLCNQRGKGRRKGKEREREREVHIRKEYSRIHDEVSHLKVMKKSLKRAQVYQ